MDYEKLLSHISTQIKNHLNSGVGLNEFCRACYLSAAVVIKLRDGKSSSPKIETLSKIAKGLKLPEAHFVDLLQFFNGHTTIDPRKPDKPINTVGEPFRFPKEHYKQLPMYKASAGDPLPYVNDYPENWGGDYSWAYTKGLKNPFFVLVEGDSMNKTAIDDGDYCLVEDKPCPDNGDIVLAIGENNGATIKYFHKADNGIMLNPSSTNPENTPIFIPAAETSYWKFYKVIETRHKF